MATTTNQIKATFGCVDKSISAKGSISYTMGNITYTNITNLLSFNQSQTLYLPNIPITFSVKVRIYFQNTGTSNQVLVYDGTLFGDNPPYVSTGYSLMGTVAAPSIAVYSIPAGNVIVPPFVMPPLVAPPLVTIP